MLTQETAKALAADKIRANCLVMCPVLPENDRDADSILNTAERLPLGHRGDPEDAARAAVFIAASSALLWATSSLELRGFRLRQLGSMHLSESIASWVVVGY
jgi:NAD(P)-dependent dehydrogenase (short-subunit alcohol dehydrogenase family)